MAGETEQIIAALEQAKAKLAEAQRQAFAVVTRLGRLRDQVQATLGRAGAGNAAVTRMRVAEQAIKDRAVEISALSTRVDTAIAQARNAAGGTGGAGGGRAVPAGAGGG